LFGHVCVKAESIAYAIDFPALNAGMRIETNGSMRFGREKPT
jgi:hypothetical protein